MRLSAFDTFSLYIAIKNHFTQKSYDFFKYGGKTRISKETFLNRKDKYQFQKLCRLYDAEEMRTFLVANFLQGDGWVGDLLQDDAEKVYRDFVKRQQSLSYLFANDLDTSLSKVNRINDLFQIKSGELPPIISLHLQNEISLETIILLNQFIGFFSKFDEKLSDDFIWPKLRMKCEKLQPFMSFDKNKIKDILKEKLDAYK